MNVKSKIAIDFLIQLVDQAVSVPPVFDHPPTPECGSTIGVNAERNGELHVEAADDDCRPDGDAERGRRARGRDVDAALPTTGNPVSTNFSWTPGLANAGTTNIVTFTATDTRNLQRMLDLTIQVSTCADQRRLQRRQRLHDRLL